MGAGYRELEGSREASWSLVPSFISIGGDKKGACTSIREGRRDVVFISKRCDKHPNGKSGARARPEIWLSRGKQEKRRGEEREREELVGRKFAVMRRVVSAGHGWGGWGR